MKQKLVVASIVVFIGLAALAAWAQLELGRSGETVPITVAIPRLESSALFWIANDQHYFSRNGLSVKLSEPDTGVAALTDLVSGTADIAGTSEYPVVAATFQSAGLRTIASIDRADYMFLEARKDKGLQQASDLRGKRVGVAWGTIQTFYLGRFLGLHGMTLSDITVVDVKSSRESVNALIDGSVDALVIAEPYAGMVRDALGENALSLQVQSSQSLYLLLVSTQSWIDTHPDLVSRLIKSLAAAEDYAIRHQAAAKAITQRWLNLDGTATDAIWSRNRYVVSLDESLIAAMEDEARWMIANDLTTETQVPDFTKYVYLAGLQAVNPSAVKVIR